MNYLMKISRHYGTPPTYAACFDPKTFGTRRPKALLDLEHRVEEGLAAQLKRAGHDPALVQGGFARLRESRLGGSSATPAAAAEKSLEGKPAVRETRSRRRSRKRRGGRLSTVNTGPKDTVLG